MVTGKFGDGARKVLCFSPNKRLICVYSSINAIMQMTDYKHQCIIRACNGESVASYGLYWRFLPNDIVLESDDLGTTDLAEFDLNILGKDRLVYKGARMTRKQDLIPVSKWIRIKNQRKEYRKKQ